MRATLTSLTRRLTREMGLPTSRDLWTFQGRSLGVVYEETYRGEGQLRSAGGGVAPSTPSGSPSPSGGGEA